MPSAASYRDSVMRARLPEPSSPVPAVPAWRAAGDQQIDTALQDAGDLRELASLVFIAVLQQRRAFSAPARGNRLTGTYRPDFPSRVVAAGAGRRRERRSLTAFAALPCPGPGTAGSHRRCGVCNHCRRGPYPRARSISIRGSAKGPAPDVVDPRNMPPRLLKNRDATTSCLRR
jgi:hypothetical protein